MRASFALPTSQEGFGIVFLEAMASSLPVIAGRAAAVPEVVIDGVTALLVEPGDEKSLTEALEKLLLQPSLRLTMGSAGLADVRRYDAPESPGSSSRQSESFPGESIPWNENSSNTVNGVPRATRRVDDLVEIIANLRPDDSAAP